MIKTPRKQPTEICKDDLRKKITNNEVKQFYITDTTGDLRNLLESLWKMFPRTYLEYYKEEDGWHFGHRIPHGLFTIMSSDLDIGPITDASLQKDISEGIKFYV